MDSDATTGWEEDDSRYFIEYGEIFTPSRREQMTAVASLVPATHDEEFLAVDMACGAGLMSRALLARFPRCRVVALDGSRAMLDAAGNNLAAFADRVELRLFDLRDRSWLDDLAPAVRCFVSSLAIHHLDGPEKRRFFRDLAGRLESGGALLIADIVEPVNEWARRFYGDAWDEAVREQSMRLTGALDAHQRFRDGWNHYVTPDADFDKPSGLFEQLRWLRDAGFGQVDCFWLRAGHAIYGGYLA